MKKRIGNDITFTWHIYRKSGDTQTPESFADKEVEVKLISPLQRPVTIEDVSIATGVVTFTFRGKHQVTLGNYVAVLQENKGEDGMVTLDVVDAVTLVAHSYMEEDGDEGDVIEAASVELESTISAGSGGGIEQQQADWAQTDDAAVDFIKNKPDLGLYVPKTDDDGHGMTIYSPGGITMFVADEQGVFNQTGTFGAGGWYVTSPQGTFQTSGNTIYRGTIGLDQDSVVWEKTATQQIPAATTEANGLMSAEDKGKLNALPTDAELTQELAGKQNTIDDLSAIRSGAQAGATAYQKPNTGIPTTDLASDVQVLLGKADTALQEHQSLAGLVNTGSYNTVSKKIELKHDNTVLAEIDATAFIKDGMVSSVAIVNGNLVITFNIDSGKEAISIPLTDIFDPANYYTKTDIDGKLVPATMTTLGLVKLYNTNGTNKSGLLVQQDGGLSVNVPTSTTDNNGIYRDDEGQLKANIKAAATNAEIEAGTSTEKAITPSNLNKVKELFDIPTSISQLSEDSEHRTITDNEQNDYNYAAEQFKEQHTIDYKNSIGNWKGTSITISNDGSFIFENYVITNNNIYAASITATLVRNGESTVIINKQIKSKGSPYGNTLTLNETFDVLSGDIIRFQNPLTSFTIGETGLAYLSYTVRKTIPTKTSDLTNDSGFLTQHQDITGKADKVSNATNGNFASLDNNGNLIDSGHKHSDYLTQHQDLTNYVQKSQTTGLLKNDGTVDTTQYLTQHQDISGKADKSEMSVVPGTDADADKTTITLKLGTSATVLTAHQDITGKENITPIEAVASGTTAINAAVNTYYEVAGEVGVLAITLPTPTDLTKVSMVVIHLTAGTTPNVVIGSAETIDYSAAYDISASKEYEINCLFNGDKWVVADMEVV